MGFGRTLLLGKADGVLLGAEGKAGALHVIGAGRARQARGDGASGRSRLGERGEGKETHELAQPIKGFSQRPAPGRISQSILQRLDLPGPLCVVLRVGWKILTAR